MGETVTIHNNRLTILHMPKAGKGEIPPEEFAAMAPAAQMAAMIRPKYKHKSVALVPGPNEVSREHLEMLEGKNGGKRNDAWMRLIRRGWVALDEQPAVRAMPQRSMTNHKRFDGVLTAVPGHRLPEGTFQPWPERKIESLFDTGSQSRTMSDDDRVRATAAAMGVSVKDKDGKLLSAADLLKVMATKMAEDAAKAEPKADVKGARIGGKSSK